MGFVKLKDLYGREIKISASAVKSYKNLGFYPVEETVKNTVQAEVVNDEDYEKSEDEKFVNSIVKKPLASWSKDEVKRYASINDIDLTGTKSANDAKERIKAFMSDAE